MANVKLIFSGTERSKTDKHELEAFVNSQNDLYININENNHTESHICLDKQTAVRLVRELKRQIALID